MADTNPTPSQEGTRDESVLEEAHNLLIQGKRFMALEDYQSATDALEQAVQLFDAYYGVAKIQCADAYLEYGLALVALANLEAGSGADKIMKKAGIDADDDYEDEDDDDNEEQEDEEAKNGEVAGANEENEVENGTGDGIAKLNGNGTHATSSNGEVPMETMQEKENEPTQTNQADGESKESAAQNQPQVSTSSANADPVPGTSSGELADGEDVENEEATTIEIAWEVLCLAKRLYMTDESLDGRLKLAETLQKLGEISIEWDNNDNAVSILEECLNIRKAVLQPEDRLIALTYYHLGLAHSFKSETEAANNSFQDAVKVIERRIESLNNSLNKSRAAQDTVEVSTYEREINELKELLPDITMRIDDSKEDETKGDEALKRTREETLKEDEEVKKVCLDKSKPVDDINHLVKRKA